MKSLIILMGLVSSICLIACFLVFVLSLVGGYVSAALGYGALCVVWFILVVVLGVINGRIN